MNKGEFIKALANKAGFTNKDAGVAYEAFVETVYEALKKGEKIQLIGFGAFELRKKAAKMGINPQTKKQVKIPACQVPAFKVGKTFRARFN